MMNGERKIFPLLSLASLFYPCFPAAYGQYDEMFPGAPKAKGNYATIGNAPGIGVGFDEKLAKEFPAKNIETPWIEMRLLDGTLQRP